MKWEALSKTSLQRILFMHRQVKIRQILTINYELLPKFQGVWKEVGKQWEHHADFFKIIKPWSWFNSGRLTLKVCWKLLWKKDCTGHTAKNKQSFLNPLFQATVKLNPQGAPICPCMHVDLPIPLALMLAFKHRAPDCKAFDFW